MDAFEPIPGPLSGLAVMDWSLQWIGDCEADDAERFLILLVPIVDFLSCSFELRFGEGGASHFLACLNCLGLRIIADDDSPYFLLRKQHATLVGPRGPVVILQL